MIELGRRPRAVDLAEVSQTLLHAHRLVGRLLHSSAELTEEDFEPVAELYLGLTSDYAALVGLFRRLVPAARVEEFLERVERARARKANARAGS